MKFKYTYVSMNFELDLRFTTHIKMLELTSNSNAKQET